MVNEAALSRHHLTAAEIQALYDAYLVPPPAKSPSFTQLAKDFGRDRETIARYLKTDAFEKYRDEQLESMRKRALSKLSMGVEQAASDWLEASSNAAEKGDHKPAKELLIATKVIDPDNHGVGMAFQINIGLPANTDPVIDAESG